MKSKAAKITVLGDGGWGTALAILLAENGHLVALWGAFPDYVDEVRRKRENKKFLPGLYLPDTIKLVSDIGQACEFGDILVIAAPSQYLRGTARRLRGFDLKNKGFVSVAKGVEMKTHRIMSQVIQEELGRVPLCVLSGPSIAREVALKMPAAVSLASKDKKLRARVREIFSTDTFRIFESDDVVGVELGGAIKNVIAISAGIVQGLGFGSNTRAALFARGVAEMARLGRAMGAKRETFMGLSGLGDLATTCLSPDSRNRWLGEEIGKGRALKEIIGSTEMVVEGVDTCRATVSLAKKHRVSMPITEAVHGILFKSHNPREAVQALFKRASNWELD